MKTRLGFIPLAALIAVLIAMLIASCSVLPLSLSTAVQTGMKTGQTITENGASVQPLDAPASAAVADNQQDSPDGLAAYEDTLEQIYAQVSPSVVSIEVFQTIGANSSNPGSPFGFSIPQSGLGSGFVWDQDGHIVTNAHVVADASEISVTFSDGSTAEATLVGADPYSDLAVIKVDLPPEQLQPIELADSSQVNVGQIAIAIGNPFGLANTMTVGVISGLERSLPVGQDSSNPSAVGTYAIPDVIQTDASINPGNSGGVLVDTLGQLIGVTAAIESTTNSNAGVGFVIPSGIVQKVVPALVSSGTYDHSWLGITGTGLTPDLAEAMSLDADQKGALIFSVTQSGPAANSGLQGSSQQTLIKGQRVPTGGDVIIAIDNQPVDTFEDIGSYLFSNTLPGQTVTLTVLRSGEEQEFQVTLGALPAQ